MTTLIGTGPSSGSGLRDTEYRLSVKFSTNSNSNSNSSSSKSTSDSNSKSHDLQPEYTPEQRRRVDDHLARLKVGLDQGREGEVHCPGRPEQGGGAGGVGDIVVRGKEGPREFGGDDGEVGSRPSDGDGNERHDASRMQGGQEVASENVQRQGSAIRSSSSSPSSSSSSSSPFIPSRRKRRAIPFPSDGSGSSAVGPSTNGNDQVAGPSSSSSTSTSTASSTNPSSMTISAGPTKQPRATTEEENGYTLILRGCLDGRWRGEGNYRCTRVWPGREGSSAALHSRATVHPNTSRSSHGNKKSSTPTQSARTRPKRGASTTRASEPASTSARGKGESPGPSSATGSTSGGKPLLIIPGLTTGPSPSPLRMAYSQPNSPEEGVSAQSLSTLDVSRVIRASSESGLAVGDSVGGGKKRRRGSAMEESTSGLDPTDLGGRLETRSASSPPAKKVARSGLGGSVASGVGLGVAGVRVSPRLSHAVPVIPEDMKATTQTNGKRDDGPDSDEIDDPMTPSGKRYTELSEQDKEEFRATWPLEALSTEEWDRKTNGEWSRSSDADKTALEETTDQDRRRSIFAHLEKGQTNGSPLATSQTTSGSSSDLGRALLKRELEAKKRLEGRAATCSPPRMVGGESGRGESLDQDVDGLEEGKRSTVGGTSMRRTLSHDTATLSRPRAPSRRGSSEIEAPVSMASSRSRREVGPPRHLRDYETEIAV